MATHSIARAKGLTQPSDPTISLPRKNWTDNTMELALKDVTNGTLSVRRAALEYDVPRSTLHDRVSGKVCPGAVGGAPRYLDKEEEEELVEFLVGCAELGYAKSVKEVKGIVGKILAIKYNKDSFYVSHGWWERFRQRHREISLRSSESLSKRRAAALTVEVRDRYFDLLEETMDKNKLSSRPALIFNCDESGIPLAHRPGKRIAARGQKRVQVVASDSKTHITVLACVNAAGFAIPPMVIYARSNLSQQLTRDEIPGTMYGLSPKSGWIDSELFSEWFERHFLMYVPAARPILLLLDGHSSHYNPEFIRSAAEKGVIVFVLPPNTTHVAQPLDNTVFKCLKGSWDDACNTYMSENPGKVVSIYQFSELFASTWNRSMTPQNIISSFRATGVFPINREAIKIPGEKPGSKAAPLAAIAKNNGINYLPLYSPAPRRLRRSSFALDFTDEEIHLFERRYEEKFDIPGDSRYDTWLNVYHPDVTVDRELFLQSPGEKSDDGRLSSPSPLRMKRPTTNSKLGHMLKIPPPPAAFREHETRGARVLTSVDYLAEIDKKERAKREKAEQIEQRKKVREENAKAKAAIKATKAAARIAKFAEKSKQAKPLSVCRKKSSCRSSAGLRLSPDHTNHESLIRSASSLPFLQEELLLFQRRYEEGYDVPGDSRYEEWKELYYPERKSREHSPRRSSFSGPCATGLNSDHADIGESEVVLEKVKSIDLPSSKDGASAPTESPTKRNLRTISKSGIVASKKSSNLTGKGALRKKKGALTSISHHASDNERCGTCGKLEEDDSDSERWIMCETCQQWYHLKCLEIRRVPRGTWKCPNCRS